MTPRNTALAETLTGTSTGPTYRERHSKLESLWETAEVFGRVGVFSNEGAAARSASYRVTITFATTAGITLDASSDFNLPLRAALEQAIARAEDIRRQFK